MSDTHLSDITFASLGLPAELMQGVEAAGFSRCTPIQAQCLPLALTGRDVAGQAQTGTGKTAAFLLAAMNHLLRNAPCSGRVKTQPRALILAPTASWPFRSTRTHCCCGALRLRLGLVYGGTGYDSQRKQLEEGVDILIGTPGRIIDYFKQHVFDLKAIQVMVLDEATACSIWVSSTTSVICCGACRADQRLNMLFSATLSMRVTELAYEHMNSPELVRIEPTRSPRQGHAGAVSYRQRG